MYQINREKCVVCGSCVAQCPKGMEMDKEGKPNIISQEEIEGCGGEYLCPVGAIEKVENK
jgi:ferredoxin